VPQDRLITIGQLAGRTGVAVSAIRFYEERGLLRSLRTAGNQRRFARSDIRRVSFILIAQRLGLALAEIEAQLATLPQGRAPTLGDWQAISQRMRGQIDERIALLTRTREQLDQCIGCGCLSLEKCRLYNPDDRLGAEGPGPRMVLGAVVDAGTGAAPDAPIPRPAAPPLRPDPR
jgi:MerR family transcriptional regulator, redox-sensitive transcriptional activator SoxR